MNETIGRIAKEFAANPTQEGARMALASLGLRFPRACEVDPYDPSGLPSFPVVLKVSQPFIAHKTEMGAVRPCEQVSTGILAEFADTVAKKINAPVKAVTLEEKITIPEGGEVLLSLVHDTSFGPVICFGEGGRLTELRKNVRRWLPGETPENIKKKLMSLPLAKVWFTGFRGMAPLADVDKWVEFLTNFGGVIEEFYKIRPDLVIRDLEINPVAFTFDEPAALDILLTLEEAKPEKYIFTRPSLEKLRRSLSQAERVAVVGPSITDPNNLGRVILSRLKHSFKGTSWAINPKGGQIDGQEVYKSAADLPEAPDVLVLAISAKFTAPTLKAAYDKFGDKLGAVLMLASGFDETKDGQQLADDLKTVVSQVGDTPIIGPNTMALYSQTGSKGDVQVDFLPEGRITMPCFKDPKSNNTALILQSGARFCSFLDRQPMIGFRWSLMVGNAYQTDVADGLALAAEDPGTKVAAVYLEGLHEGAGLRLAQAVRKCCMAGKIVIIQKGGSTAKGASTARSHTASMSGSHEVFADIVAGAGALIVESETDFIDVVRLASVYDQCRPQGRNVFVINGAGYEGVLTSDEAARQNMELPKPPNSVTEVLKPFLGQILDSTNNPADVGPATVDAAYGPALENALESDIYDAALVAVMPHGNGMTGILPPFEAEDTLLGPSIVHLTEKVNKPVVVSVNGGAKYQPFRNYLEDKGIPVYPDAERAMRALGLWTKLCLKDQSDK